MSAAISQVWVADPLPTDDAEDSLVDVGEASPLVPSPPGPGWKERLLYGLPGVPNHLIQKYLRLWNDLFYLTDLNAPLQALALFDTILSGALMLVLPMVGSYSDRITTRWGRRRPMIAVLAPLAALGFLGLMWVPSHTTAAVLVWYMMFSLLQRFQVALQLCYKALGAQISLKSHQRVRVFAWASAFGGVGLILGTAVPTYFSDEWQYRSFGIAVAVSIVVFYGAMVIFVKERADLGQRKDGQQIVPTIMQACSNYPFMLYMLSQVKDSLSLQESYTFKWLFHLDKHQIFISFLTTFGTAFCVSLVWTKFGSRIENKYGAILGYMFTVLSVAVSLFLPAKAMSYSFGLAMLHAILEGIGVGSRNTFLPAVAADCIEYDQLLHGNRREAQYKTTEDIIGNFYGLGYGISLALLGAVGFEAKESLQSERVVWMMRGLQVFKIATHLIGIVALYKFPITHRIHQVITKQVLARRKGLAAIDPLTGHTLLPPSSHRHPIPNQVRTNFDHFGMWEWRLVRRFERPIRTLIILVVHQVVAAACILAGCITAAVFTYLAGQQASGKHEGGDLSWLLPIEVTVACLALGWLLFNALRVPVLFSLWHAWGSQATYLDDYVAPPKGDVRACQDDLDRTHTGKDDAICRHDGVYAEEKGFGAEGFLSVNAPLRLPA